MQRNERPDELSTKRFGKRFGKRSGKRSAEQPTLAARVRWPVAALLAVVGALLLARPAAAETVRVAVVVGHNTGGPSERPLRYAEDDAVKLADVLVELGEVAPQQLFLVRGKPVEVVTEALRRAAEAVSVARRAPDDRVILTFFFSGHSDASGLQLGATRLLYGELKRLMAASKAEVKLTIIDGCKSGGMVATKGGRPGSSFEIGLADHLSTRGEATLTSSAADEASLESSEIRGSFFTHHLVSGLRGAADGSGDGRVTLSEAYEYAFHRTVAASAATGSAPQHPNYDYQLTGGGELVLTRVGERSATLRLPAGFERALVINVMRDQVIAELVGDAVRVLAVAPGEYSVRLWQGPSPWVGRVRATARTATDVTWDELKSSAPRPVQGKSSSGGGFAPNDQANNLPIDLPIDLEVQLPLTPQSQAVWDRLMLSVGDRSAQGMEAALAFSSRTYEGGRQISAVDFLRRAGRKDLAKRVADRAQLRIVLGVGSGVAMLGGLIWMITASSCDIDDDSCFGETASAYTFGTLLVVGGGAAGVLSFALDDDVPEAYQLRTLADDYNRGLRSRLLAGQPSAPASVPSSVPAGAPAATPGTPPAAQPVQPAGPAAGAPKTSWLQVMPNVTGDIAGVVLRGRF